MRLDLARIAQHYAVLSLFEPFDDTTRVYCYEVVRHDFEIHKAGRARLAIGHIEVRSMITRETTAFELAVLHLGETEISGGIRLRRPGSDFEPARHEIASAMEPGSIPRVIRLLDTHFGEMPVSIRSLLRDELRRTMQELVIATLEEAESAFRQLHERYDPMMKFHARLGVPIPKVLQTAAEFDLNLQMRRLLADAEPLLVEIESRLREAREEGVTLDATTLLSFRDAVERMSESFLDHPEDLDRLETLEGLLTLISESRLEVEIRRAQDRYCWMRNAVRPAIAASANGASQRWLTLFDSLGEKLAIAV
jgi:hypothetical protein